MMKTVSDFTFKPKGWIWILTFPFAHNNVTAINGVIYHPKGRLPEYRTVMHEEIHLEQQKQVGLLKFLFLYVFSLPLFYNPWRFKWELVAFMNGSKIQKTEAIAILRSWRYGWLRNKA